VHQPFWASVKQVYQRYRWPAVCAPTDGKLVYQLRYHRPDFDVKEGFTEIEEVESYWPVDGFQYLPVVRFWKTDSPP